jgi:acyl-CoA synthetase (AMP-forming)/AMP-acid ligase II
MERETAATIRDGWLDTGDLGFVDEHGDLFVTGRVKDIVIVRGRNWDPSEFERVVGTLPGVRTGRVVAAGVRPEAADGEQLWLFVETRRGLAGKDRAGLVERCRTAALEATGVRADRIELLDPGTIPRTSSGKNRRLETVRRHFAGTLDAPGIQAGVRVVTEMIRGTLPLKRHPHTRSPSSEE